jgi:hypothetical protein
MHVVDKVLQLAPDGVTCTVMGRVPQGFIAGNIVMAGAAIDQLTNEGLRNDLKILNDELNPDDETRDADDIDHIEGLLTELRRDLLDSILRKGDSHLHSAMLSFLVAMDNGGSLPWAWRNNPNTGA